MATARLTALAKAPGANGHAGPYDYLSRLRIYSRFARNYDPAQQEGAAYGGRDVSLAEPPRELGGQRDFIPFYAVVKWPSADASIGSA